MGQADFHALVRIVQRGIQILNDWSDRLLQLLLAQSSQRPVNHVFQLSSSDHRSLVAGSHLCSNRQDRLVQIQALVQSFDGSIPLLNVIVDRGQKDAQFTITRIIDPGVWSRGMGVWVCVRGTSQVFAPLLADLDGSIKFAVPIMGFDLFHRVADRVTRLQIRNDKPAEWYSQRFGDLDRRLATDSAGFQQTQDRATLSLGSLHIVDRSLSFREVHAPGKFCVAEVLPRQGFFEDVHVAQD